MIGLIALAVVAVYIGFWWFVFKNVKNRWAKGTIIAIALAIPFWDLPIGYLNFQRYCLDDGGIRQLEDISPQKSLYFVSGTGYRPEYLFKSGLDAAEYRKRDGTVTRVFKTSGGTIQTVENATATSSVRLRTVFNEQLTWNLYRQEELLEDNATGRPLARARSYTWLGGWIQRQTAPMLTPAAMCYASSSSGLIEIAINGVKK